MEPSALASSTLPVNVQPMVSVVVVSWNSAGDLPCCLKSIQAQTYHPLEILVVDNGSTDGSLELLKGYPDVIVIRNRRNRGFAAANNQGIARALGDWVFLLNADAHLEARCLERLMQRALQEEGVGSLSPKIYRADGRTLDSTGIVLQKRKFCPADRGEGQADAGQFNGAECEEILGPTAAAALYRKQALGEASRGTEYLDEDFFAYYEDVDIAWRLRLLRWRSLFVSEAAAYHDRKGPGGKPGWIQRRAYANRYFCYVKNEIPQAIRFYALRAAPRELIRTVLVVFRHPSMLAALAWTLYKLPAMLRKRKWIQALRQVSVEEMRRFE